MNKGMFGATDINITFADWSYGSLRSATIVSPYDDVSFRRGLFTYSRASTIPGTEVYATEAHTNIPRAGDSGLPTDWEMLVYGWRATASVPLEQPVIDFASQCSVRFNYNLMARLETTLLELLFCGCSVSAQPWALDLPIRMHPGLSYGMVMQCDSSSAWESLRRYLLERGPATVDAAVIAQFEQLGRFAGGSVGEELERIKNKLKPGRVDSVDPEILAELQQLARLADGNVGREILRVQKQLQPGRVATFWGHIEGYIKRVVC